MKNWTMGMRAGAIAPTGAITATMACLLASLVVLDACDSGPRGTTGGAGGSLQARDGGPLDAISGGGAMGASGGGSGGAVAGGSPDAGGGAAAGALGGSAVSSSGGSVGIAGATIGGAGGVGGAGGGASGGVGGGTSGAAGGGVSGAVGGGGVGPVSSMAVQECNRLTTTLCTRAMQCVAAANEPVCESQLRLEFGCARAPDVDFAPCNQDAQTMLCADLFPAFGLTAPTSCLAPITAIPLSDAQTKCYALVDLLCTRALQCAGRTPTNSAIQSCEDDVTTSSPNGIPCLLASTVGPEYAQCIAAIPALGCASGGAGGGGGGAAGAGGGLPAATIPSCAKAIGFSP